MTNLGRRRGLPSARTKVVFRPALGAAPASRAAKPATPAVLSRWRSCSLCAAAVAEGVGRAAGLRTDRALQAAFLGRQQHKPIIGAVAAAADCPCSQAGSE